jgi:UDP-glucuronate 4-epimerase
MSVANKSVLLTGGAGFIGSHLAEALLRAGARLSIVDNLNDFYSPASKQANLEEVRLAGTYEFFAADICDIGHLRDVFIRSEPELVIHLAACAGVRRSIKQPQLYQRVNVGGTVNILELCREFAVSKMIFGSSSSVYGATGTVPFSEAQTELRPISPYAATKLAGEMLAYTYARLFGIMVICLRFFTVYGPRQRPDLAVHKFTGLLEAGLPLPIFGDGSSGRDYTHVDDIVAGVMASVDYEPPVADGARFEVFNLGNSHPVSVMQMVALLEELTGRNAIYEPQPVQSGDVPFTWADVSKAKRLLGYNPRISLENGLKDFVVWHRACNFGRPACETIQVQPA